MFRGLVLIGVILFGGCCSLPDSRATKWLNQVNPFTGTQGEKVVLRTYLLDQPAGDPYLSQELWTSLLRPLPAEKHALLSENGLRVAQLTGNPPYQFLNLAKSDDAVVKPMEYTTLAGEPKTIALSGSLAEASFQAFAEIGAKPGQFTLKEVETAMSVTATPLETGRVKLTLEPKVQHGSRMFGYKPNLDATAFTWLDQKTQERFPSMKFEVTLAPEEFLIVGASETPANTLGGACFMSVSEQRARMRVLVIQAAKFQSAPVAVPGRKAPVIAAQASQPLARGQRP